MRRTRWRLIGSATTEGHLIAPPDNHGAWGREDADIVLNIVHCLGEAPGIFNRADKIEMCRQRQAVSDHETSERGSSNEEVGTGCGPARSA